MSSSEIAAAAEEKAAREARIESNSCRFYENKYPNVDDLVVVQVKNVAETGAYVQLLEYNNIEGLILMSELSRRRIRSINKLIRVGRTEVVVAIRVDMEKGYIDLSKRRVAAEDIAKAEEKYNKARQVHQIMRHLSETTSTPLEELYQMFCWDLYKRFGHAYDAFRLAVTQPEVVLGPYQLPQKVYDHLSKYISRKLAPQAVKLRADIELTCFSYDGIDAIKEALRAGESCSSTEIPIKIKLVAPPLYVMITSTIQKDDGLALLNSAIEKIRTVIRSKGGELNIQVAPRAVSETDDHDLNQLMEKMERQNTEVSGDDDIE